MGRNFESRPFPFSNRVRVFISAFRSTDTWSPAKMLNTLDAGAKYWDASSTACRLGLCSTGHRTESHVQRSGLQGQSKLSQAKIIKILRHVARSRLSPRTSEPGFGSKRTEVSGLPIETQVLDQTCGRCKGSSIHVCLPLLPCAFHSDCQQVVYSIKKGSVVLQSARFHVEARPRPQFLSTTLGAALAPL